MTVSVATLRIPAMRCFATLAARFCGQLGITGETPGFRCNAASTFASGFSCQLRVAREAPLFVRNTFATLASDFALLVLVHRGEASVGSLLLVCHARLLFLLKPGNAQAWPIVPS